MSVQLSERCWLLVEGWTNHRSQSELHHELRTSCIRWSLVGQRDAMGLKNTRRGVCVRGFVLAGSQTGMLFSLSGQDRGLPVTCNASLNSIPVQYVAPVESHRWSSSILR